MAENPYAWLQRLKVGDQVIVERFGHRRIDTVSVMTESSISVKHSALAFRRKDGRAATRSMRNQTILCEVTSESVTEPTEMDSRIKIGDAIKRFHDAQLYFELPLADLEAIAKIIGAGEVTAG